MKKLTLFLLFLMAGISVTAASLQLQQRSFSEKMIRMHIVANSDTREDQQLKLQVRDAVLNVVQGAESKTELSRCLPQVASAAQACLREHGSDDRVCVTLKKERFPTRIYDVFSLPAGVYTALRVTIGDGAGHNWWCVAFPSICLQAASDWEETARTAGFSSSEIDLITEDGTAYVLKFKALEWLEELKVHLANNKTDENWETDFRD